MQPLGQFINLPAPVIAQQRESPTTMTTTAALVQPFTNLSPVPGAATSLLSLDILRQHLHALGQCLQAPYQLCSIDFMTKEVVLTLTIRGCPFHVTLAALRHNDPTLAVVLTWLRTVQQAEFDFFWPYYIAGRNYWQISHTGSATASKRRQIWMSFDYAVNGCRYAFDMLPQWFRIERSQADAAVGGWRVSFDAPSMYIALKQRLAALAELDDQEQQLARLSLEAGEAADTAAQQPASYVLDLWDMTCLATSLDDIAGRASATTLQGAAGAAGAAGASLT
jgi:hypothetical protein